MENEKKEEKLSCIAWLELIERFYKNLWPESSNIIKEQTRIPLKLTIEKNWCRQKRIILEQFMQISVHAYMKSTNQGICQQETLKRTPSWSNQFGIPIAELSVTLQYDKTSIQSLKHGWKKLIPITEATISIKTIKWKREALATFLHVWTAFEHQVKDVYASQTVQFFF